MPVTPFQAGVLRLLAPNRSRDSFVAGGIALQAHENIRWSADVDVFHDAEASVMVCSDRDLATLEAAGYAVVKELWTPAYRRASLVRCARSHATSRNTGRHIPADHRLI